MKSYATLSIRSRNEGTFIGNATHAGCNADGVVQRTRNTAGTHQQTSEQSGWNCADSGQGKVELVRNAADGSSRSSNFLIFSFLFLPQKKHLVSLLSNHCQCLLITILICTFFLVISFLAFKIINNIYLKL